MGNVTSNVAAKFAFFPPDPPTYDVFRGGEDGKRLFSGVAADKNMDVHLLDTKGGNRIVATFWRHPLARFTRLYSHGNAADLGQMKELFVKLRADLKVNIMSYDYSGYGASSGKLVICGERMMILLICLMGNAFGSCPRKNMNHYGSRVVVTATWKPFRSI